MSTVIVASNVSAHYLYSTLHDRVSDVLEGPASTFQLIDSMATVPITDTLGSDLEMLGERMSDCNEGARFLFRVPTHGVFETLHGPGSQQDVRQAIATIQTCVNDDTHQTFRVLGPKLRTLMGIMTQRLHKEIGFFDVAGTLHTPEWDLAELTAVLHDADVLDTAAADGSAHGIPSVAINRRVWWYLTSKIAEAEPSLASIDPGIAGRLRECVARGSLPDEMSSVNELATRLDEFEQSQLNQ